MAMNTMASLLAGLTMLGHLLTIAVVTGIVRVDGSLVKDLCLDNCGDIHEQF
jgi:hypothetical protein